MTKAKKEFNLKLYAVIVFFLVAGFLATVTTLTYTNKYNGFNSEKVALSYVEGIANRGDGYNAYKSTVMSKNYKYGDFIREYYMYPLIYRNCNYKSLDSRDGLKGYNDDSFKGEKTLNDTGKLQGQVIDAMYPFYVELVQENSGWDNYDTIFNEYFKKLAEVREEVFGDKYLTDEIMFTALEANVSSYGDSLAGDEDGGKSFVGLYQQAFGADYKITCEITETVPVSFTDGKVLANEADYAAYKISNADITEPAVCYLIAVKVNGKTVVDNIQVSLIKIGSTWYVDNLHTDTSSLYNFATIEK